MTPLEDDVQDPGSEQGSPSPSLRRRDLIKLGAAAVVAALGGPRLAAQRGSESGSALPPPVPVRTRAGYVYDANRENGNGPMDDTTRGIVKYVSEFSESRLTSADFEVLNKIMLDAMAALVAGFEEEPVRRLARLARQVQPVDLKCTVLGYGIPSSPELAAFVNSAMLRHCDFNDLGPGGHVSDLIPAALAIGEAVHASGPQVLAAIALGYELRAADSGGEAACAALISGKLFGLNEDKLANALAIALTPHVTLNKGVGALSMWKGLRSAEPVKCGVWSALMAREGVTGPPQPFEGRGGLWSRSGMRTVALPVDPSELAIHRMGYKRFPAEGSSQSTLEMVPGMRAWTRVDEIDSIHHEMPPGNWVEIADAPKWDPHNRETADHSLPYILARALMDGEVYLDSFTPAKYNDPAARALMARISCSPRPGWSGNAPARTTIRKKSGEERTFETQGGRMVAPPGEILSKAGYRLSFDEVVAKFNRACAFQHVTTQQRDRARAMWSDIRQVKDIGQAMGTLATFGTPRPLSQA